MLRLHCLCWNSMLDIAFEEESSSLTVGIQIAYPDQHISVAPCKTYALYRMPFYRKRCTAYFCRHLFAEIQDERRTSCYIAHFECSASACLFLHFLFSTIVGRPISYYLNTDVISMARKRICAPKLVKNAWFSAEIWRKTAFIMVAVCHVVFWNMLSKSCDMCLLPRSKLWWSYYSQETIFNMPHVPCIKFAKKYISS